MVQAVKRPPTDKYTAEKDQRGNWFVMKGERVAASHSRDWAKAKKQAKELNETHYGKKRGSTI